jgi:uncharacterized membrane protein
VSAVVASWQVSVLIGWGVACVVLLGWVFVEVTGCDAAHTRERATIVDPTHTTAAAVVLSASLMSLVGVGFGLAKARQLADASQVGLTLLSVLVLVLSWMVVHTMFMLRYAHEYYMEPVGGVTFPGSGEPDYADFAYLAFTIGVAFAVSDSPVDAPKIRRVVLRHALMSYLFGAVIIGLAINVTASFVR